MEPRHEFPDIIVAKAEFDRDPAAFMRRATPDQRVIVRHASGRVSAVFGGSLDVAPDACLVTPASD